MPDPSFNLLDEEFTTWRTVAGKPVSVGIRELLRRSDSLAFVCDDGARSQFGITRLLLALMHRTRPDARRQEWEALWDRGIFPDDWLKEIESLSDEFFLFHAKHPFNQSIDPKTDLLKTATYLLDELPRGTEINHFRKVFDDEAALCLACCSRGLIELSAFATQGGQGKSPSINGDHPSYSMPAGRTLFETLMLNWPLEVTGTAKTTVAEAFTWKPRCVKLSTATNGSCAYCGADGPVVYDTIFTKGQRREHGWIDPHVSYKTEENGDLKPSNLNLKGLRMTDMDRYWTRFLPLLYRGHNSSVARAADMVGDVQVYSVIPAGDQAKRSGLFEHRMTMPGDEGIREKLAGELDWLDKEIPDRGVPEVERTLRRHFEALTDHLDVTRWRAGVSDVLGSPPDPQGAERKVRVGASFLHRLRLLSDVEQRALKHSVALPKRRDVVAHKAFTSCFWPARGSVPRDVARLVASLYFWNPKPGGKGSLVTSLQRTHRRSSLAEREMISRLVRTISESPFSLMADPLLRAVQILARKNEPVDWNFLLKDLSHRHRQRPSTQRTP